MSLDPASCGPGGCTPVNNLVVVEKPPTVATTDIFTVINSECPGNWRLCRSGIKCNSDKGWHLIGSCQMSTNRDYDGNFVHRSLESFVDLSTGTIRQVANATWKYSWDFDLDSDSSFEGCVTDDRDQAMGWRPNGYNADLRERGDANPLPQYLTEMNITCMKSEEGN